MYNILFNSAAPPPGNILSRNVIRIANWYTEVLILSNWHPQGHPRISPLTELLIVNFVSKMS
jgi:hypothetical protein